MCQWGANINPWAGYRVNPSPTPRVSPNPQTEGVEKSTFQIAAKLLEIDENVNRARLVRHFTTLNLCLEQYTDFAKAPNERTKIEHTMSSRRAV